MIYVGPPGTGSNCVMMEHVGVSQAWRTLGKCCMSRRQRVSTSYLCPLLVCTPLPLPGYHRAAVDCLFGLTLHHLPPGPRTVQGVCSSSLPSTATLLRQAWLAESELFANTHSQFPCLLVIYLMKEKQSSALTSCFLFCWVFQPGPEEFNECG